MAATQTAFRKTAVTFESTPWLYSFVPGPSAMAFDAPSTGSHKTLQRCSEPEQHYSRPPVLQHCCMQ